MSTTQPTQQQNQARSKGHHRNSNKAKNNTMYVKKTEEKNEQMLEDQWDIPNPNLVVIAPPPPPPQKQPQTPQKNEQKYQKQEAAESDIAGESTGDQDKSQQKQLANLSESTIEASDSNNTPKQRNSNLNATRGSLKQQKGRNSQQQQQQNHEEKGGNQQKNHQRNSKHSNTTYVPKASLTTNEVTQSQTLQSTKVQISTDNVSQSVYVPLSSVTKEHQENNKSSQQSRRSHHVKPTFETYTPKYKNNNNNNNNNNDNSNTNNNNNNNNQNSRGSFKQAANERYSHGPSQYASKFSQQNNNNNNLVNGENNENKDTNGNQFEDSPQKNQRGRYNNNNGKNRNPKRNQSEVRTPATMFSYGKTIYEEKKETEEQIQSRIAKEKEQQAEEKEQLKEFSKQIDKTLEFQRFHDAKTILKKENDKNLTREQRRVNRIIRENRKNHSIIKSPAGNQLAATNWDGLEDVEQSYEYLGRRTQGEQQDVSVSGFGQQDSTSKQNFPSLLDDSTSKLSKFAPSSIRPSRKGSFQSSEAGKDELTQEIEKARLEIEQESKQAQQSYNSQQQQISTHDIEIVYTEVKEVIHENEEDNYIEDEEDNEHTKKSNNQKKMNNKNESKTPQSNKNQKSQDKQIKKEKNGRGSQISTRNSQKDVYVRKDQLENDSPLEAQPQQQYKPKQQQTQPQNVVYQEKIVEQPIQYKVYYEEKQPEEQQKEQQEEYQVEQYEEEVEYGDVLNGLELEMELEVAPSQSRQGRNNQRQERDLQNANFQNNLMNLQQGNVEDDDEEDVHHHQDHRNGSTHKGQQSHEPEARISNLDEYVPYQLTAEDKEAFEREHYQEEQNEIKDLEQQEIQQQSTHIVSSVSHQAATLKSESSDEVLQQKEEDDEENDEDAILSKPNCKSPPPTENITHNDVDAAAAKFEENAENSNQDSPLKKPSKVSQFKKHEEDNELELKVIEKLKQEHMLEESDIQSKQVEQVAISNQQEDKTIQKVEVTAVTQTNQVSESKASVKTSTSVENGVQQAATVSVVAAAATSAVEHVIHQEQDIIIFTGETTTTTTSSTTTTTQATHTTKVETHSSQIQETHSTQHNVEVHSKVIESSVAATQQIRNEQSLTTQTSESSHVQSTQREDKQITEDQVQYDEEEVQYEEEIVEQEEELEIVTTNQKRNRSENRERDLQALNGKQLDEELKHEQEQAQSLEPTSPKNDEKEGDNVHVSNEKHDRLSDELDKQCEYFNANSNYSSDKQNNTQTQDDTSSAKHIEMNGFLLDVQSEKNFDDFNHDLVSEYAKTEAPKRQTRFLQQFSDNLKDIGKSNAFIVNSLGSNIATTFAGFVCNKIVTSSLTKNGKLSQSQSNRSLFSSFSSYHSSIKN